MLDPAFTFARPNNRQTENATLDFPLSARLQPGSGPGNLADEPTLRALFGSQVAETFAPPRAIFWEGDPVGHVFHVLEGCFRLSRVLQDGRRAILGFRLRRRSPGRFVPQM